MTRPRTPTQKQRRCIIAQRWRENHPDRVAEQAAKHKALRQQAWRTLAQQTRVTLEHFQYYSVLANGRVHERLQFRRDTQTFVRNNPSRIIGLDEVERVAIYLSPQAKVRGASARWFEMDDVYLERRVA